MWWMCPGGVVWLCVTDGAGGGSARGEWRRVADSASGTVSGGPLHRPQSGSSAGPRCTTLGARTSTASSWTVPWPGASPSRSGRLRTLTLLRAAATTGPRLFSILRAFTLLRLLPTALRCSFRLLSPLLPLQMSIYKYLYRSSYVLLFLSSPSSNDWPM